jgi:SAM-dependent methyltransferase
VFLLRVAGGNRIAGDQDRRDVAARLDQADLRRAWEHNAPTWLAWAREPGHDSYWRFHRDAFLEVVPDPGRGTLDLGCGEGRLSRDLQRLGHAVTAVDASPTLAAAAREAAPGLDVVEADAAALPFDDGAFDLVIAFMSLQDIDDFRGAILESARVLSPGGRLCIATVHPLNSAGDFAGDDADSPFVIDGSYLDSSWHADEVERDGLKMTFVSEHRPIDAYTDALADAGLLIERLRELRLPAGAEVGPHSPRRRRIPLFLHLRAVKPA